MKSLAQRLYRFDTEAKGQLRSGRPIHKESNQEQETQRHVYKKKAEQQQQPKDIQGNHKRKTMHYQGSYLKFLETII